MAAAVPDEHELLKECIKQILNSGGVTTLTQLQQLLTANNAGITVKEIKSVLTYNQYTWFDLWLILNTASNTYELTGLSNLRVLTSLKLCKGYCEENGCANEPCADVHMCRDYTLRSCSNKNCNFSHDFYSVHNLTSLRRNANGLPGLSFLTDEQLKALLITNRTEATVPQVCTEARCPRFQSGHCVKLHICRQYLHDVPHQNCPRSHAYTPHDIEVLNEFALAPLSEETRIIIRQASRRNYLASQARTVITAAFGNEMVEMNLAQACHTEKILDIQNTLNNAR